MFGYEKSKCNYVDDVGFFVLTKFINFLFGKVPLRSNMGTSKTRTSN